MDKTILTFSTILCLLFVVGLNGFQTPTPALASASGWCEIGVPYRAVDGLTVTLNSFTVVEKTGSYQYMITYTLKNDNLDIKIAEGFFKIYYKDSSGGLPQYGFFGDLFPGDTISKSYTFEELKSKPFDVLEYYYDNFFRSEPAEDSLKWKVKYPDDNTPPITVVNYDGLWHTTDFTISLTATDDLNEVNETFYRINNGPIQNVSLGGQPTITSEGANNTLEYWSVDSAGNEELPHKILTGIKLDKTAPTSEIPSRIPENDAEPDQEVKVLVNVTDFVSAVQNVTLSYNLNGSTMWIDLPMIPNSITGLYEATIPVHQANTLVKYRIEAYDNALNHKVDDNNGQYYVYRVIPEFPSILILPLFMTATLLAVIVYRRRISRS